MALGGRGAGVPPLGISGGAGTGVWDSHMALDGSGLGAARGTTGSRGPGTSGSRKRWKGGYVPLSPGFSFG